MAVMRCTVALPDRALFQGEVSYASIPGTDGYFGVLPGHELAVSLNREGGVVTLTVGENEQDKRQFLVNQVTVLARFGCAVEDIDAEAVKAEADECRAIVADLGSSDDPQDQATLVTNQKKLEWCEAQLKHVSGAAA